MILYKLLSNYAGILLKQEIGRKNTGKISFKILESSKTFKTSTIFKKAEHLKIKINILCNLKRTNFFLDFNVWFYNPRTPSTCTKCDQIGAFLTFWATFFAMNKLPKEIETFIGCF